MTIWIRPSSYGPWVKFDEGYRDAEQAEELIRRNQALHGQFLVVAEGERPLEATPATFTIAKRKSPRKPKHPPPPFPEDVLQVYRSHRGL